MTPDEAVRAFASYHLIDVSGLPEEELDAIQSVVACHNAVAEGYASLPTTVLEGDMAVGLIWQLFERCNERVHGAIVTFATSCAAASEIVARASIEASTTLRYILQDRNPRLASYLTNHLEQAERQEKQWRTAAENLSGQERTTHLFACEYRRDANTAMKKL